MDGCYATMFNLPIHSHIVLRVPLPLPGHDPRRSKWPTKLHIDKIHVPFHNVCKLPRVNHCPSLARIRPSLLSEIHISTPRNSALPSKGKSTALGREIEQAVLPEIGEHHPREM